MIISFGHLTKKCLLFLAVPIVMFIDGVLTEKIKLKKAKNMFHTCFLQFLGRSLHGFLWLAVKKRMVSSKIEEIEEQEEKNKMPILPDQNFHDEENKSEPNSTYKYSQFELDCLEKRKMERKDNRKKLRFLILVCILDFFSVTIFTIVVEANIYVNRSCGQVFSTVTAKLFSIAILSHLIIKKNTKMYSHQYLSVLLILILIIYANIYSYTVDPVKSKNYFSNLFLLMIPELLYSIMYVCGAKYLSISKGNIFKFLFIDGIIGMILSIILQIFFGFFKSCDIIKNKKIFYDADAPYCNGEKFKTMIENLNFNKYDFFISIFKISINFIETWFIWLLIFNFTVNHFGAIHSIPLLLSFLTYFNNFTLKNYIGRTLVSILIILNTFVYNEIIILRFCDLDKNTAVEIHKRAIKDIKYDNEEEEDEIDEKCNGDYFPSNEDSEGIDDKKREKL